MEAAHAYHEDGGEAAAPERWGVWAAAADAGSTGAVLIGTRNGAKSEREAVMKGGWRKWRGWGAEHALRRPAEATPRRFQAIFPVPAPVAKDLGPTVETEPL